MRKFKDIDWATKLSSRKFWSLLIALIIAICILFNVDQETATKVASVIGAFASIVVYILAEAHIDAKRAENDGWIIETDPEKEFIVDK